MALFTVRGDARADLAGVVVDGRSGERLPFTDLTLTLDGLRQVGRRQTADLDGGFRIGGVQTGMYLLLVEHLGYESQYLPVLHGVPAELLEVRLSPDTVLLRGLATVSRDLELRRRAAPGPTVSVSEVRLRTAGVAGMRAFVDGYTTVRRVPCVPQDTQWHCFSVRGQPSRPVVFVDDRRLIDVPPRSSGPILASPGALAELDIYDPRDLHGLEYFECSLNDPLPALGGVNAVVHYVEIRAYTRGYMERMARQPRSPLPACLPPPPAVGRSGPPG